MIKFTYTEDEVITEKYTVTEYYTEQVRQALQQKGMVWTEEEGTFQDTIPQELEWNV